MIDRHDITGLVLAGGRGSRMGGVDKGLQLHRGRPLALHALIRLQPQVGAAMLNANRNLEAYRAFGVPVWPDAAADFAGPLAGFLAGLEHCGTAWMVTVPCDSPDFPADLAERLAAEAGRTRADVAMAACVEHGRLRPQPVFTLMRKALRESLQRFTADGGRKIDAWTAQQATVTVAFPEAAAFANANTLAELQALQRDA